MYNKIISIPFLIIGICLMVFFPEPKIDDTMLSGFQWAGIIVGAFGFIWMFASLMTTMGESSSQLERFKNVIKLQKSLKIAMDFKTKIEKESKEILTVTFPNFEKDLVSKFSFENAESKEAFLAICPKLESGSSFGKYVEKLFEVMKEIRNVENAIEEALEEIAVYNEDPWLWFRRPMPANIKELIAKFEGK